MPPQCEALQWLDPASVLPGYEASRKKSVEQGHPALSLRRSATYTLSSSRRAPSFQKVILQNGSGDTLHQFEAPFDCEVLPNTHPSLSPPSADSATLCSCRCVKHKRLLLLYWAGQSPRSPTTHDATCHKSSNSHEP